MTIVRVCDFCGHQDPRWDGVDDKGWTKTEDGRDRCPDCGFMQAGPNPEPAREDAFYDDLLRGRNAQDDIAREEP